MKKSAKTSKVINFLLFNLKKKQLIIIWKFFFKPKKFYYSQYLNALRFDMELEGSNKHILDFNSGKKTCTNYFKKYLKLDLIKI